MAYLIATVIGTVIVITVIVKITFNKPYYARYAFGLLH